MSETSPGGTTQQFTWNTHSSVPQLLMDGSNAYIYGPQTSSLGNAPVEQISLSAPNSQSSASYLLSDPEGVRLTFNSSGVITAYASYDAYGNVISGGLSSVTPFGYAGGYTDPTGLIYLVNRYYDPSTGQFLSVDPLVGVTDQPYQYVGGDPVNGSDPLGLCNWNPISGSFWTQGNCLSGAVGGPNGGGGESVGGVVKSVGLLAGIAIVGVWGGSFVVQAAALFGGTAALGTVAANEELASGSLFAISYPLDALVTGLTLVPTALAPLVLGFAGLWWLAHNSKRAASGGSGCP